MMANSNKCNKKYMRKSKGESTLLLIENEQNLSLYALQSNLLKIWTQKKVDKYYQNAILAYLDNLPQKIAKQEIIREHERMLENKSQYNKIKEYINHREEVLDMLQEMLQDESQIQQACESLDQLRKINLKLCQCIFEMKNALQSRGLNSNAISQGYNELFKILQEDNQGIINSYLKKYIAFGQGYDPFFLVPYERIQKKGMDSDTPECVQKLFKMNISYVYRLIKVKHELVKSMSCVCIQNQPQLSSDVKLKNRRRVKNTIHEQSEQEEYKPKKQKRRRQVFERSNIYYEKAPRNQSISISQGERDESFLKFSQHKEDRQLRTQSDPKQKMVLKLPKIEDKRSSKQKIEREDFQSRIGSRATIKKSGDQYYSSFLTKNPRFSYQRSQDDEIDAYRKRIISKRIRAKAPREEIQETQQQSQSQLNVNIRKLKPITHAQDEKYIYELTKSHANANDDRQMTPSKQKQLSFRQRAQRNTRPYQKQQYMRPENSGKKLRNRNYREGSEDTNSEEQSRYVRRSKNDTSVSDSVQIEGYLVKQRKNNEQSLLKSGKNNSSYSQQAQNLWRYPNEQYPSKNTNKNYHRNDESIRQENENTAQQDQSGRNHYIQERISDLKGRVSSQYIPPQYAHSPYANKEDHDEASAQKKNKNIRKSNNDGNYPERSMDTRNINYIQNTAQNTINKNSDDESSDGSGEYRKNNHRNTTQEREKSSNIQRNLTHTPVINNSINNSSLSKQMPTVSNRSASPGKNNESQQQKQALSSGQLSLKGSPNASPKIQPKPQPKLIEKIPLQKVQSKTEPKGETKKTETKIQPIIQVRDKSKIETKTQNKPQLVQQSQSQSQPQPQNQLQQQGEKLQQKIQQITQLQKPKQSQIQQQQQQNKSPQTQQPNKQARRPSNNFQPTAESHKESSPNKQNQQPNRNSKLARRPSNNFENYINDNFESQLPKQVSPPKQQLNTKNEQQPNQLQSQIQNQIQNQNQNQNQEQSSINNLNSKPNTNLLAQPKLEQPGIPQSQSKMSNQINIRESSISGSQAANGSPIKREIQMKPGQITLTDLFKFIQEQKVAEQNRKQFQVGPWKQNIKNRHCYLTKFFLNSQIAAFGICTPRTDGDYEIFYWGIVSTDKVTVFLFKKYVQYLQKFTILDQIYIDSGSYLDMGFEKQGDTYVRQRSAIEKKQLNFTPFLEFECSNICFKQENDPDHQIFYSEEIEDFKAETSETCSEIALVDNRQISQLPSQTHTHLNLNSMNDVNQMLQKYEADTYAFSQDINTGICKLILMKGQFTISKQEFYVRDGFFKTKGNEIYDNNSAVVYRLEMEDEGIFMYFGKKFNNIQQFLKLCAFRAPGAEKNFAFKMFSKQLYGRIKNKQFLQTGCYANWDISFVWQDQLKGTVIKDMPQQKSIFGPESFFVAIYKLDKLLFGFQVNSNDFLF